MLTKLVQSVYTPPQPAVTARPYSKTCPSKPPSSGPGAGGGSGGSGGTPTSGCVSRTYVDSITGLTVTQRCCPNDAGSLNCTTF